MEKGKVTLSVIKADVGGYVGHSSMHQSLLDRAKEMLSVEEVMERLKSRFKSYRLAPTFSARSSPRRSFLFVPLGEQ
jgi:hypothetical protein